MHYCTASDMHPYNCEGRQGGCIHCLEKTTKDHDPQTCALCNWDQEE